MKKMLAVALVLALTVMVVPPMAAEAGGRGGSHGGHGYWRPGPWLFGMVALGAASNIWGPRAYAYPAHPAVVYTPARVVVAPYPSVVAVPQAQVSIQRASCSPSGCYYLQGDGFHVPYQWVWVPSQPMTPPPPPPVPPSR